MTSKITAPSVPHWVVPRPRVRERVAAGARGPLTTVVGPPGAGKTMAITMWAAEPGHPGALAWVTLDSYDNEPKAFWSYVVAALRRAGVPVPRLLPVPAQGQAADHEFLQRFAAVLAAQDPPVVLVLDDLHLITSPAVLDGLGYVLRHAKRGLHLVAAARMDPLLPLHAYRLAGELAEVRADDLAFSAAEAGTLLAHQGVRLSGAALDALTARTEGWAAGIRLAALSLDGHPDPEQFVKDLGAEDSAITSYLVDEVLDTQPPPVRDLLLRTSILDTVNPELAVELAGDERAAAALPALARQNAFVRPLGHGWYRYHSLFSSVLRLKLRNEGRGRLHDLNRRASEWHRRRGHVAEAVRYAADSGDWPLTARIVVDELAIDRIIRPRGAGHAMTATFRRMPPATRWLRPEPWLVAAALAVADGAVADGRALATAEELLRARPAGEEPTARLAAALIAAARARIIGDAAGATAAAARAGAALDGLPDAVRARKPEVTAQVCVARGAAKLLSGPLDAARADFRASLAASDGADGTFERADSLGYLALLSALQGWFGEATDLVSAAVAAIDQASVGLAEQLNPVATLALAAAAVERGDLRRAHDQLRLAGAALRAAPDRLLGAVASLVAARGRLAEDRGAAAAELVREARAGWTPPEWLAHRLFLLESRIHVATGDVPAALAAAGRAGPGSAPAAAIALGRAHLAAGDLRAAQTALDRVPADADGLAEPIRLTRLLLAAQLGYTSGDGARGRRYLREAFRLARRHRLRLPVLLERGWLRPILRHDPELAQAFHELIGPDPAAVVPSPRPAAGGTAAGRPAPRSAPVDQPLAAGQEGAGQPVPLIVELPSDREREVLRYLADMLSTAEIASEMYISVNTVKTHLRSIYRKLSVDHRSEAVRRARQLRII